jgi:hypothetical protein
MNQIISNSSLYPVRVYLSYPYSSLSNIDNPPGIYYYDNYDYDNQNRKESNYNIYSIHGYFNNTNTVGRLFAAGNGIKVYDAITMIELNSYSNDTSYNKVS